MRSTLLATISAGILAGLFCGAPSASAQRLGLEVSFIQRQIPQARVAVGTNQVLLLAEATVTSRCRVYGELFPLVGFMRPVQGSIVELEIGGRAFAQSSTASAAITTSATSQIQNGVSTFTYIYSGESVFFELRGDFYGTPRVPSLGRAWVRVKSITTPDTIPDLTLSGPLNVGIERRVYLNRPSDAGLEYLLVATLDTMPGIVLPDSRVIPANPDLLFYRSLDPTGTTFVKFYDYLDGQGRTFEPRIVIPSYQFVGLGFYLTYITLDYTAPWGVRSISNAKFVRVLP